MSFAIRASTALENMFTSPDRVNEYIALPQEEDRDDRGRDKGSGGDRDRGRGGDQVARSRNQPPRTASAPDHGNNEEHETELAPLSITRHTGTTREQRDIEQRDIEYGLTDDSPSSLIDRNKHKDHEDIARGGDGNNDGSDVSDVSVIVARNIVARYAADLPPALNNLNFTLQRGRLVGICGRTGSGKSSLTLLLARAITDFTGELRLRGKLHSNISLSEYRAAVQVFPQSSYIFSGRLRYFLDPTSIYSDEKLTTLLDELSSAMMSSRRMKSGIPSDISGMSGISGTAAGELESAEDFKVGDERATDSSSKGDVNSSAEASSLSASVPADSLLLEAQKLQLDLVNTAGGSNLSSGQKQVLALARAALADARVVLLDEITSNMDTSAAKRAIAIVKRELVCRGVAVVLIAHSLADVSLCDEVWVMADGRIVEQGEPTELMGRIDGLFAYMTHV
jgi:ABC-type multidrug transport system fused ATPase/permease subunit